MSLRLFGLLLLVVLGLSEFHHLGAEENEPAAEPETSAPADAEPAAKKDDEADAGEPAAADANPDETKPDEGQPEEGKPEEGKPEEGSQSGPLPGHSYHGEVFNEGPRQKAYLMEGMPKIHFPVTTKSPEAQKFIEQGVGQLHGFWYYEAERSFRQAAMLDPDCAMAYWGMALANMDNAKRSTKFMDECKKREQDLTERETMYIDALDAYVRADSKKKKERNETYTRALEKILYKYPDDIEAKALLAVQLWKNRDGGTPITSYLAVDALLEQVFQADPMHPAHHYRIHLWDLEKPEKALASSALCGQSSSGVAHMWHMPGHIYSRVKRYEDACWQQEASARVDHAHMMRDRVMPDQIHNFAHNNEWLIRNMVFAGRMTDALDLAKNMCELPRHPKYNTPRKGSANFGRMRLFEVLARFELWEELIALTNTPYLEPTDDDAEQLKRVRHLGMAHYRRGDVAKGDEQLAEVERRLADERAAQDKAAGEAEAKIREEKKDAEDLDKLVEKGVADAKKKFETKINNLTKAADELKGHQAVAAGKFAAGHELLKKSGHVDADYLAWVQFQAGEKEKAITAAKNAVRSRKGEVIPLSRLVELQWLAGKNDDAKKSLEQLREIGGSIDPAAPVFARVTKAARELGYGDKWQIAYVPQPDTGDRPSLDSLGPFRWQPSPAAAWTLADAEGSSHSLSDYSGKPVIVIFYLGYGCLHCAEQVQAFGKAFPEFAEAGIEIIAISSDDANGLKQSIANYKDGTIPFPLVADQGLDVFKSYRCYDDFEQQTLHGTFLIDGQGLVRWQDISYEPFQDTKFLLGEAKRLLAQSAVPTTTKPQSQSAAVGR